MDSKFEILGCLVQEAFASHQTTVAALSSESTLLATLGIKLYETIERGNKILIFGNGGSAADAQHIAAEIVGRFMKERDGLPCIALTTDSSILTAVGNDYGFDHIFSRQVNALACHGDLVVGISTSGNSKNVVEAISAANEKGCFTVALTGESGGTLAPYSDLCIKVPCKNTATVQECHILIGHILCAIIDSLYISK
jgi:D-sedoheptulose 7-phosphate isomerase